MPPQHFAGAKTDSMHLCKAWPREIVPWLIIAAQQHRCWCEGGELLSSAEHVLPSSADYSLCKKVTLHLARLGSTNSMRYRFCVCVCVFVSIHALGSNRIRPQNAARVRNACLELKRICVTALVSASLNGVAHRLFVLLVEPRGAVF